MSTHLQDEVRAALGVAADAVEPPPMDRVAFQGKVRVARGRRVASRTGIAVGGAGAVAAGVAGVLLATSLVGDGSPSTVPATSGPATFIPSDTPTPAVRFWADEGVTVLKANGDFGSVGAGAGGGAFEGIEPESLFGTVDGVALTDGQSGLVTVSIDGNAIGVPERMHRTIDNIAVSADGTTAAWFELRDSGDVAFVLHDFRTDRDLTDVPVPVGNSMHSVVAVDGKSVLVSDEDSYSVWGVDLSAATVDLGPHHYVANGSWSRGVLALTRDDYQTTDLFRLNGADAELIGSIASLGAQVSPEGDNVVGFTLAAEEPALYPDENAVAVWSTESRQQVDLTGVPETVYQTGWLDNDTIVLTGSDQLGGTWPGTLDIYTCELATLECSKVFDDPTGDQDRFPMVAGTIGR